MPCSALEYSYQHSNSRWSNGRLVGSIDKCIFVATLLYITVWFWLKQWFPWDIPMAGMLSIMYLARIVMLCVDNSITPRVILATLFLVIAMLVNILLTGQTVNLFGNLIQIAHGFSALFYFCLVIYIDKDYLFSFLVTIRPLLNIYVLINMVIMFLQLNETYFLINAATITNPLYLDHIAGLLGQNGTHRVTCLCLMVVMLNFSTLKTPISRRNRLLTLIFIFTVLAGYSYLSTQNDNVTFLFIVPAMIAMFILFNYRFNVLAVIGAIVLVFVIVLLVTLTIQFMDLTHLVNRFDSIYQSYSNQSSSYSENRIRILNILLEDWNGWTIGSGIGGLAYFDDPRVDALHYGMNSIQSVIGMGGVFLYGIFILLYSYCVLISNNRIHEKACTLSTVLVFILFSYYTMIFSGSAYIVPLLCSLYLVFYSSAKHEG